MSKSILILGAGGHAKSCIDVIERNGEFKIVGLVGLPRQTGSFFCGYPILGADNKIEELAKTSTNAIVGVGQIKNAALRIKLFEVGRKAGFSFPPIISPFAIVSRHAVIGSGSVVMHGAIVNSNAIIGENCIINTNALIEHDANIGAHCHISTGAILNGGVNVGSSSFIGSAAVIKQGIQIGPDCTIGMGAVIRHHVPQKSTISNGENYEST